MPSKQALACKHAMMVRDVCGDWWNMWSLMCDMRGMGAFINASALPQAPLVLGFDMTDKVKMDRVWPVGVLTLDLLFGWVFFLVVFAPPHIPHVPHVRPTWLSSNTRRGVRAASKQNADLAAIGPLLNGYLACNTRPTITNPDILMINEQWAGHPGTLIKVCCIGSLPRTRGLARAVVVPLELRVHTTRRPRATNSIWRRCLVNVHGLSCCWLDYPAPNCVRTPS